MFGENKIIGQSFFKDADPQTLKVTSIFYTLQGEGPYAGKRCVFVRLAHCNLNCRFCDSFFDDGEWLTYQQLQAKILDCMVPALGPMPYYSINRIGLVITGGEPTLQANLFGFLESDFAKAFAWTQIESNGVLVPNNVPTSTTIVVSPKCSKNTTYIKPLPETLERAAFLKFVVSSDPSSPYNLVPDWAIAWMQETGKPVYVSPMNIYNKLPEKTANTSIEERSRVDEVISFWEPGLLNMKANQANHEYAARLCLKHGFVLNLQMHLYAGLA